MDLVVSFLNQGASAILPFIILLGILIFVHEFGHFYVAKLCGVRVEVFSLGFGKKIFQYKKGDTNYCLSLIPMGGYVKMFGDEAGAVIEESQKKYSFTHKNVWQRIAIVLAGPMMNFFFAILIFMVLSFRGEEFRKPVLGDIQNNSAAFDYGFRSGDELLKVNSQGLKTWDQFQKLIQENFDRKVLVEVRRENSDQLAQIEVTPKLRPNPNLLSLDEFVGDVDGLNSFSQAAMIGVQPGSIAEKLGFHVSDQILKINDRPIQFFRELENVLISFQKMPVQVLVERKESDKTIQKTLQINLPAVSSLKSLGIESSELYLFQVVAKSPAEAAGLLPLDRITRVNEVVMNRWDEVLTAVKSFSGDNPIQLEVLRKGEIKKLAIKPQMTTFMTHQGSQEKRYTIGIVPMVQMATPAITIIKSDSLISSMSRGYERTWEVSAMTLVGFLRLIQNKISPKNIGGVISIGQAASETFKMGLNQFLHMMAIISVNLFILNLLPIPVLDGGHLLFYVIEAIKGAPVSMRKMEVAQQVGLVLLVSLMAFALLNDFRRVFGLF